MTMFRRGLYLGNCVVSHPATKQHAEIAKTAWDMYEIGTILNVSSGEVASKRNLAMYRESNIYYEQIPIDDSVDQAVRPDFAEKVLDVYKRHVERSPHRGFLVNCSAGINRSALASGIILWTTTPNRPWSSVSEMVVYMRRMQLRHRQIPMLLVNPAFQQYMEDTLRDRRYS